MTSAIYGFALVAIAQEGPNARATWGEVWVGGCGASERSGRAPLPAPAPLSSQDLQMVLHGGEG